MYPLPKAEKLIDPQLMVDVGMLGQLPMYSVLDPGRNCAHAGGFIIVTQYIDHQMRGPKAVRR